MQNAQFLGTGVALVTPLNTDKTIDYKGLERLLNHTYADGKGVDYWVVMGTTGESATLNKSEKRQVLDFVLRHNPANIPVVYGIGGNNSNELKKQLQSEDLEGVSAVLSVSPYYNKPSQAGIISHYQILADASPKPIILYNVPGRTASNLLAETTLALAEHQNIIAVKEAAGDLRQCTEIAKHKPQDFLLISGDDMLTVPMISVGAEGVISVLANAFPQQFAAMVAAARAHNFQDAQKLLYQFSEIDPLMYRESNPVGVKQALQVQGVCQNTVRLPLLEASADLQAAISEATNRLLV